MAAEGDIDRRSDESEPSKRRWRRYRYPVVGGVIAVLVVAVLLFRPDKYFIDDTVDESLDEAFAAEATTIPARPVTTTRPTPVQAEGESAIPLPTEMDPTTTTTTTPGPLLVTAGAWEGIDHVAAGSASVYQQDGRHVLRFEDGTDIQNGPDLYVWVLADHAYPGGTPGDYIDLGKIKGNTGGQNYPLPAEFDPDLHRYVLIWCLRFSVPFAGAALT